MKKTLIALAVLGAASAAQAQSSLTIYGELNPSYEYVTVKEGLLFLPGVKTKTTAMNNNASFIGFRGTEDLGGGLKALFQLEAGYDMVNDGGMGVRTVAGDRNSFVGLEGRLGTVRFGAIDGAYKRSTASYDAFADTIGDYNSIMGTTSLTNVWMPSVNINNNTTYRQAADYVSPSYNGFQLSGTYALTSAKVSGGATTFDASRWDLGLSYTNGPLNLLATYSKARHDWAGYYSGVSFPTQWFKVGAAYTFSSNTTVRAIFENVKSTEVFTGGSALKIFDQRHLLVGVEHPINNIDLMANYIKAGNNNNIFVPTGYSSGAHAINLGVRYNFSKRTNVMGVYTYLKNDDFANFGSDAGYSGASMASGSYAAYYGGATISGVSVRLKHIF